MGIKQEIDLSLTWMYQWKLEVYFSDKQRFTSHAKPTALYERQNVRKASVIYLIYMNSTKAIRYGAQ